MLSDFSLSVLEILIMLQPVVSAPGGNILSTYLTSEGGYAVESGTSMACPFTAGAVALYLQAKGKGINPRVINAALSASATPLVFNDGSTDSPFLATVAQQGGGLLNAYALVHSGTTVSESSLTFNDTAHHVASPSFYVQNEGSQAQTYSLTHVPSANAYAFDTANASLAATFPPPQDTKYATVTITPSSLSLAPGEKQLVTITATPDPSLNPALVPFYSGYINITSEADSLSIPYGGVATIQHDIKILGGDGPWPFFDDELAVSQDETGVFTFKPSVNSTPIVYWNVRWATAIQRLDVVSTSGKNPVTAAGLATVGAVSSFPLWWEPRGIVDLNYEVGWDGLLADNSTVPTGTYKFVLRFLKPFGDASVAKEYETYETEAFVMDMS